MTHVFSPTILREYDIRGLVDQDLTEADVEATGRAFGTMVRRAGGTSVALGYDGRESSPRFAEKMAKGLAACGLRVINVGMGPTPLVYFASVHLKADAAVVITGSHNPPEYNGIKMVLKGASLYGDSIQNIGRLAALGDYVNGTGSVEHVDVIDAYIAMLARTYATAENKRTLKVVWDNGNGAGGEVLQRLVKALPCEHTVLFGEVDGTFPNHHPDPSVEKNLADLKAAIAAQKADVGIAFDGDADRIGVVDETGCVVWADQLLALYASVVLEKHAGATVIADVKTSQSIFDVIASYGGKPLMWKTGRSLIQAKMIETHAPLGGELSGHIFFGDNYNFDDAFYCAVKLLLLLLHRDVPLSTLREALPKPVNTPEVRFQVDESRKFQIAGEIKARLTGMTGIEVCDIDGVRVKNDDGWWLVRPSNTQDVLGARVESSTPEGLERLKATLVDQLRLSGIATEGIFDASH